MPVTPNGTAYTVYTATIPGLGRVRWIIADDAVGDANVPAILYAHGANGSVGSFSGGASWAPFREWWLDLRGVVIEGEGGTFDASGVTFNHWGNTMNRQAYRAYLEHVAGIIDIGPLFAIGSSMGGLVTKWLATRSDIAADINGLISFAAVGTMFYGNLDTNPADTPSSINQRTGRYFGASILNAYGVATYEQLEVAAADHAPELWDPSVWAGKRILEMYADNDIAVPWSPRGSARLRDLRAGIPAVDQSELHTGITVGHDLSGGTGAHLPVVMDFMTAAMPQPPETDTVYVAETAYVSLERALYPIEFADAGLP